MNRKNLIILCVIFAILIGLVFVKQSAKPRIPETEEVANIIIPAVSIDGLSEIVLRIGDRGTQDKDKPQNVHLAKEGDKWTVRTHYGVAGNEKTITPVLDKLDQLRGELRSDRKGLLGDYGISDDEGVHVELRRPEAEDIHVVIGTKKAGYQNNFVRLGGTDAVYIVNENLLGDLGVRGEGEGQELDAQKWIDKRIAHLKVDDVAGIEITQLVSGAQETVMDIRKQTVDEKKKWQSVKPYAFTLSASKIKSVLEKFNSTYAREVIAPDAPGVFDSPGWIGTFTFENGEAFKLVRGAKDAEEKNYYVKEEGAGYFYLVPVSTFDGREKQQGDIFADNSLGVEDGNVEGIEIQDIDGKKSFNAVKKPPMETTETPAEDTAADQEPKAEFMWQSPEGEVIETAKVKDIISKLKDMKLEAVTSSTSSPKEALIVGIAKEGETTQYTISTDIILENGKECHFLRLRGDEQDYCVSKDHVTALRDALP